MIKNGFNLDTFHAGKPSQKLVNSCAILQIFKQSSDQDARTAKNSGPAQPIRISLNCLQVFQVHHRSCSL
jgi:hypothetical protein